MSLLSGAAAATHTDRRAVFKTISKPNKMAPSDGHGMLGSAVCFADTETEDLVKLGGVQTRKKHPAA